jgi:hypothetical protein
MAGRGGSFGGMETGTVRPGGSDAGVEPDAAASSGPLTSGRWRAVLVGAAAGAAAFGLVLGIDALRPGFGIPDVVSFPETIPPHSIFVASGEPEDAAVLAYQNGFGVETFDDPQLITVGADGRTFRRLAAAERRGSPADQGDPARTLLAPDGTFAVIAGAGGQGSLRVEAFGDGEDRELTVGDGRSALPLSIGGGQVLALTSDDTISPYLDMNFRLRGELELVDLATGARTELGLTDVDSGALSPDGSTVVAAAASGVVVIDVARSAAAPIETLGRDVHIGDDAWSPDGSRFAVTDRSGLHVVDAAGAAARLIGFADESTWASVLGWRDDETVLVQLSGIDAGAQLAWVDAATGTATTFAVYEPGFSGAAMANVDAARELVPLWTITDIPADQGPNATVTLAVVAGVVVWLVVWLVVRRALRRRSVHRDGPLG